MPQHKGGKKHKDRRSTRNKQSGKYIKQRARTEANKLKRRKLHELKYGKKKD